MKFSLVQALLRHRALALGLLTLTLVLWGRRLSLSRRLGIVSIRLLRISKLLTLHAFFLWIRLLIILSILLLLLLVKLRSRVLLTLLLILDSLVNRRLDWQTALLIAISRILLILALWSRIELLMPTGHLILLRLRRSLELLLLTTDLRIVVKVVL